MITLIRHPQMHMDTADLTEFVMQFKTKEDLLAQLAETNESVDLADLDEHMEDNDLIHACWCPYAYEINHEVKLLLAYSIETLVNLVKQQSQEI